MRTRPRDLIWAVVAAALAVWIAWILVGLVRGVDDPGWAEIASLLIAVVLLLALPGRWLIMGAWRRTKWGAPVGGAREVVERRRIAE